MDGYVFFEVDNMGNPIYGDKMKELLNCEKEHILFILSAEYRRPADSFSVSNPSGEYQCPEIPCAHGIPALPPDR